FIAGTDTGVGKTTVAVGLARLALRGGRTPIPYKPVETGCDPQPADALRLWEAARPPTTLAETCPYPLALPAAPAAAASAAGVRPLATVPHLSPADFADPDRVADALRAALPALELARLLEPPS